MIRKFDWRSHANDEKSHQSRSDYRVTKKMYKKCDTKK